MLWQRMLNCKKTTKTFVKPKIQVPCEPGVSRPDLFHLSLSPPPSRCRPSSPSSPGYLYLCSLSVCFQCVLFVQANQWFSYQCLSFPNLSFLVLLVLDFACPYLAPAHLTSLPDFEPPCRPVPSLHLWITDLCLIWPCLPSWACLLLAERHDRALDSLLEQFHRLSGRPPTMVVTPQLFSDSAASSAVSSVTPLSREPRLPHPERFNGELSTCWAFLAQCALIFELQPSSFPSDCSKIAYLITLMSGRALTWATAVWEQQPSLEGYVGEVRKVFDAPNPASAGLPQCSRLCSWFLHVGSRVLGTRRQCSICSCTAPRRSRTSLQPGSYLQISIPSSLWQSVSMGDYGNDGGKGYWI